MMTVMSFERGQAADFVIRQRPSANDFEDTRCLVFSLHTDTVDLSGGNSVLDRFVRMFADEDGDCVLLGNTFQTRCQVDAVSHDRVVESHLRTHVADHN